MILSVWYKNTSSFVLHLMNYFNIEKILMENNKPYIQYGLTSFRMALYLLINFVGLG